MNNELYHYGVLGMKWGVRKYQNADGTYTEAGKKRYFSDKTQSNKEEPHLTVKQKKIIMVAAGIGATALVAGGAYYLHRRGLLQASAPVGGAFTDTAKLQAHLGVMDIRDKTRDVTEWGAYNARRASDTLSDSRDILKNRTSALVDKLSNVNVSDLVPGRQSKGITSPDTTGLSREAIDSMKDALDTINGDHFDSEIKHIVGTMPPDFGKAPHTINCTNCSLATILNTHFGTNFAANGVEGGLEGLYKYGDVPDFKKQLDKAFDGIEEVVAERKFAPFKLPVNVFNPSSGETLKVKTHVPLNALAVGDKISEFEKKVKPGSFGMLFVNGHVFNWETDMSGKTTYIDSQCRAVFDSAFLKESEPVNLFMNYSKASADDLRKLYFSNLKNNIEFTGVLNAWDFSNAKLRDNVDLRKIFKNRFV